MAEKLTIFISGTMRDLPAERVRAAEALEEMRLADDLLAMAQDRMVDDWLRKKAAEALGKLGQAEESAELLLALTWDQAVDDWVREEAVGALGRLGGGPRLRCWPGCGHW